MFVVCIIIVFLKIEWFCLIIALYLVVFDSSRLSFQLFIFICIVPFLCGVQ